MITEIVENKLLINSVIFPLPNFCYVKEIGRGANSRVFLANNVLLGRTEAIKIWVPRSGQKTVDEQRFREEVKKNANVQFQNIARFYDAGIFNGIHYARLEYIHGITLKDFLNVNPDYVVRYHLLKKIIEALILVYESGYYHGDLHLKNVIMRHNEPWIIDFGTSVFSGETESHDRDCKLLIKLCFDVLPELRKIIFLEKRMLLAQGSSVAAAFIYRCSQISWDIETYTTDIHDRSFLMQQRFALEILTEEFRFVNNALVEKFITRSFHL